MASIYVTDAEHESGERIACLAPMGRGSTYACLLPDGHEGGHMVPMHPIDRLKAYGLCAVQHPYDRGRVCIETKGHEGDHRCVEKGSEWPQ